MAVMEKSAQDILIEQLAQHVGKLTAEQKAKEAAIRELNSTIKIAEAESVVKIAQAQEAYELKRAELSEAIAPLVSLKQQCEAIKAELVTLRQEKIDAASDVKAAKSTEIRLANEAVSKATARLSRIEMAIQHCKASVANL